MARINFMGDVMFAELLENYRRGLKTVLEKKSIDPFEHVGPLLKEADFNVINLECVLSDSSILDKPFSEILIAPESSLRFLADNRINVVNTANNHALDHGRKEFDRSISVLKGAGIHVIGYDTGNFFQKEPVLVEAGGRKYGFLGYNISNFSDTGRRAVIDRVRAIVTEARQSADTIIISMHWGEEYTNVPPPYVIQFGKELLEAGVDILHGHHSHQIQGVLRDGDRIFAPSLGNFIFDQMVDRNRITAVLQVDISGEGELDLRYLPHYMNDRFQPEPAPEYMEYIEKLNGLLADCYEDGREGVYASRVEASVRKGHQDNRLRMRARMLSHFWDYLPHMGKIIAFRRRTESMYSVIKSDEDLIGGSSGINRDH
jgi:poly-gamma-glutamate synthesis protein (capsule biosynthesis protein)